MYEVASANPVVLPVARSRLLLTHVLAKQADDINVTTQNTISSRLPLPIILIQFRAGICIRSICCCLLLLLAMPPLLPCVG